MAMARNIGLNDILLIKVVSYHKKAYLCTQNQLFSFIFMKRLYSIIVVLFSVNMFMLAQNINSQSPEVFDSITFMKDWNAITSFIKSDIIQFMGIPVDGTKKEMIKKLKKKGFRSDKYGLGYLEGEFNGRRAKVFILTNKKKVWRIAVVDEVSMDADNIKTRFNDLCYQFYNSDKYSMKDYDEKMNNINDTIPYTIPDDEDISFNIEKLNKNYEASFSQRSNIQRADIEMLLLKGKLDISMADPFMSYADFHALLNKSVCFTIRKSSHKSGYVIIMYYDNIYNQADGEDL